MVVRQCLLMTQAAPLWLGAAGPERWRRGRAPRSGVSSSRTASSRRRVAATSAGCSRCGPPARRRRPPTRRDAARCTWQLRWPPGPAVQWLLAAGGSAGVQDASGLTPLHYARCGGHGDVSEWLRGGEEVERRAGLLSGAPGVCVPAMHW